MTASYREYKNALSPLSHPVLFLDQKAFDANIDWVIKNSHLKKIRLSTKSIRSVELMKRIFATSSSFQGLMTYTLEESLWLRNLGFNDIVLGYPTTDRQSLIQLVQNPEGIVLMVDLAEHLEFLEQIAVTNNSYFNICVDLDLSMNLPGVKFGVYRSSIHQLDELDRFLIKLKDCPHLKLVGAMGYEAQISAVMDKNSWIMRMLKSISLRQLQKRRAHMIERIRAFGHHLSFVNGGGTGSLLDTVKENCVTEITVGSAFYAPVLFDYYQNFSLSPALQFTLPIVRHPANKIYTCLGGGYIASGETHPLKTPTPFLPEGMKLLKHEGAGEVQTPVFYDGKENLKIGDFVIMRHAKAGEICEHFSDIQLFKEGKVLESVKTYRGDGKTFL